MRRAARAVGRLAATSLCAVAPQAARADLAVGPVTGEVAGYLEARQHVFFGQADALRDLAPALPDGYNLGERRGALERLRPTMKLHLGEDATLVATAEGHTEHGFFDTRQEDVEDIVGLERLYVTATSGDWDHTAGKQNIAWGSGLLLNPTDPFNDKNPADLQAERPGLWALKSLYAYDDHTNFTLAVATPAEKCCAPVSLVRFDTTLENTDLALLAAWDSAEDAALFGVDVRSEIEVGLWLEAGTTVPEDAPDDATTSFELGLDYSFDVLQTLYLAAEYMYQQIGAREPGAMLDPQAIQAAVLAGASPESLLAERFAERRMFSGRDYAVGLVRLEIASDWRAQVLNVTNVRDRSGLLVPQLSFLPADAWTFTLGAQLTYGPEGGEYTMTLPTLSEAQAAALPLASPELGPALVSLQGERLMPAASVFLWGRYAF